MYRHFDRGKRFLFGRWTIRIVTILSILLTLGFFYKRISRQVWTGRVVYVSRCSGDALVKCSLGDGKDTVIRVHNGNGEQFVMEQEVTFYTGGKLVGGIGSTKPE